MRLKLGSILHSSFRRLHRVQPWKGSWTTSQRSWRAVSVRPRARTGAAHLLLSALVAGPLHAGLAFTVVIGVVGVVIVEVASGAALDADDSAASLALAAVAGAGGAGRARGGGPTSGDGRAVHAPGRRGIVEARQPAGTGRRTAATGRARAAVLSAALSVGLDGVASAERWGYLARH